MNDLLMHRTALLMNNGKKNPFPKLLIVASKTVNGTTNISQSITADNVDGYSFLCWAAVTWTDYDGTVYFENQRNKTTYMWKAIRPNQTGYHIKAYAYYVKNDIFTDQFYTEVVSGTYVDTNTSSVSAPYVEGYTFLFWGPCATIGFVGYPYIDDRSATSAYIFSGEVTSSNRRTALAFYVKDSLAKYYKTERISSSISQTEVNKLIAPTKPNYSFLCWIGFSSINYYGAASAKDYLSSETEIFDPRITYGSRYGLCGYPLYVAK